MVVTIPDSPPVEATPKTICRPDILTLQGLYSATKNVYSTYIPATCCGVIEDVATKLIVASSPLLGKALESFQAGDEAAQKKATMPSSLAELDVLVTDLLASGDEKIESLLVLAEGKIQEARKIVMGRLDEVKSRVEDKATSAKTFALGKYDEVKPLVTTRVESAKELVLEKMEDPRLEPWVAKVKEGVSTVKEGVTVVKDNAEPAKVVITSLANKARNEISEKGVVSCAHTTAEFIKTEGATAFETCKSKGLVEGSKEISSVVLASVKTALVEAKLNNDSPKCALAGADEIYSSADEKAEDE